MDSDGDSDDGDAGDTVNQIPRQAVECGVVECPLCSRQFADVDEVLVTFGTGEATPSTADAVECHVCGGVTFIGSG